MKLSDITAAISRHRGRTLCIYLLAALILPNVALCFTEHMSWLADAANLLVPAGIYATLLGLSPRLGRSICLGLPVMFFAAFQIVLLYLFGSSVIAVDMFLNLVTSNASEMLELLGDMWVIILVVIIVYAPLLTLGVVAWKRRWRLPSPTLRRLRLGGLSLTGLGMLAMIAAWADGPGSAVEGAPHYDATSQLFPLNVAANAVEAADRHIRTRRYLDSSAPFDFEARATRPDSLGELYIVVIGETSRADRWQLNGAPRHTCPRLARREGVTYYSRVMSESNTTHKSVPMLLSPVDAADFDSIYHRKGLLAAFGQAGFDTYFISNQQRNGSFIDYLGLEAREAVFLRDTLATADACDMAMLPGLAQRMARSGPQLLVVHSYGSHFKYSDRYPEAYRHFTPDAPLFTNSMCRSRLLNAYDNTIVYTDALLDSLIGMAQATGRPAALLYVSDHGEDLFDDARGRFLHASPIPTAHQLHVPMLLWLSPAYRRLHPREASLAAGRSEAQISGSATLFHTMLGLAGITSPWLDPAKSLVSPAYTEPPRRFLTDRNHAVDYRAAGFTSHDAAYLDSLGIR